MIRLYCSTFVVIDCIIHRKLLSIKIGCIYYVKFAETCATFLSRCVQTTNQDKAVWFKMMNIEIREFFHKIIIFQVFNGFPLDRNTYSFYTPIDPLF